MDNSKDNELAAPAARERGGGEQTRKRTLSSSSSSSSSTSDTSCSDSSCSKRKRSRRHRRKKSKRSRKSNRMMDKLFKEIGELKNQITIAKSSDPVAQESVSICSGVSGDLYNQHDCLDADSLDDVETQNYNSDFTFEIETKLKEPSVPKTPDNFLKMLLDIQHFGDASWSEVRYADTQKLYNHSPGFTELDTNDEVKMFDTLRHLAYADKSYAAITYCILKQKEALQESIRTLLSWAKTNDANLDLLGTKVEELFLKGDFHKVSSDLLQLVCGHRAESIEMRRENITSQVRDPLVKVSLNRIPPSPTHIFDSEPFTAALEKAGGVRKAFWNPKGVNFSQTRPNQSGRRPSRGQGTRRSGPSRGTQNVNNTGLLPMYPHACNGPPSRGAYHTNTTYPPRGQPSNFQFDQYHSASGRGTHNRGSRPDRGGNRGRSNSSKSYRGNQKKFKQ